MDHQAHACLASDPLAIFDERSLVDRARLGDARALRVLYQRHSDEVLRTAILPVVRDATLAKDLLADTFVRAIENLHRFHWQAKGLLPWLVRIAKNLSLDHLRRSKRMIAWPRGLEFETEIDAELLLGRAELADLARARIDACMAELSPRYQLAIRLRLIEQLPRAEAAAHFGVTTGTLDVILCRACKAFRKHWRLRFGGTPPEWP
ncbi:RNA polymerase sigma factor [Nannocystaceae bacterium ST9]